MTYIMSEKYRKDGYVLYSDKVETPDNGTFYIYDYKKIGNDSYEFIINGQKINTNNETFIRDIKKIEKQPTLIVHSFTTGSNREKVVLVNKDTALYFNSVLLGKEKWIENPNGVYFHRIHIKNGTGYIKNPYPDRDGDEIVSGISTDIHNSKYIEKPEDIDEDLDPEVEPWLKPLDNVNTCDLTFQKMLKRNKLKQFDKSIGSGLVFGVGLLLIYFGI